MELIIQITFVYMKNRNAFSLLIGANVISGFAQGISMISIPWYFTQINELSLFGWTYGAITFASIFWSVYAGSLIDRYSRKNLFLLTSVFGGIILLSVSLYGYFHGDLPSFLVLFVFAATICVYNIYYPALYAFGQEISEKENYGKMNSYLEIQGQATTVLSGAIGAILLSGTSGDINFLGMHIHLPFTINMWKMHEIFLMDGITYFIGFVLIWLVKYKPIETLEIHKGKVIERIKMGFNYLRKVPALFVYGSFSNAIFVVLLTEVHLLLPLYVNNHLKEGADVYASAEIYYAFGAMFSGFFIRHIFRKANPVKASVFMLFVTVLLFCTCTFTQNYMIFFFFSAAVGITNAGTRILRITYLFNHIPNNYMGRAGSVFSVLTTTARAMLIALFSISFFSTGNNVIWAYFICGIFVLLCVFPILAKYKELKI